jgi:hypothetical protein
VTIPFEEPTAVGRPFVDLGREIATAILMTIEGGWRIAVTRAEANPTANEVALTECLRDGMREALDRGGLPWGRSMIVAAGTESKSRTALLRPDGLTDIPLYLIEVFVSTGAHDPHAIVECKRVREGDAALSRAYVVEGIDRFRDGKYASDHRVGYMVGYALRGSPTEIVEAINAYLDGSGRSGERLTASDLIVSDELLASEHPRPSLTRPIELHHAILPFARDGGVPGSD